MYQAFIKKSWYDGKKKGQKQLGTLFNAIDLKEFYKQRKMIVNVEYETTSGPTLTKTREIEYSIRNYFTIQRESHQYMYDWLDEVFVNEDRLLSVLMEDIEQYYGICFLVKNWYSSNDNIYTFEIKCLDDNTKENFNDERVAKAIRNVIFGDDADKFDFNLVEMGNNKLFDYQLNIIKIK